MKPIKEKKTSKNGIIEITGGWSDFTYPNQKLSFWGTYPKQEPSEPSEPSDPIDLQLFELRKRLSDWIEGSKTK